MASAYTVFFHSGINVATHVLIGTKHVNCPNNGGQRAFPGGRANQGENLFDAARRETREETLLQIPPWPDGGQAQGQINGQQYTCSGRQFSGGFYVAYIQMANRGGLDALCTAANTNLVNIPFAQREFVSFQVVSAEDAMQAFADDDQPNTLNRRTDWFKTAVSNIP